MTPEQEAQRVTESPAPKGPQGKWISRAALPLPRSEMAWATSWADRMHIVGGYGEGRVDRPYHHVYDPASDRWLDAAPLPRGANHVSVAADAGRVYALGGFMQQNRGSDQNAYAYDVAANRWDDDRAFAATTRCRRCRCAERQNPSDRRRVGTGG